MSPNQIDFSDYHRTVIGYHGTSVEAAQRLVDGEEFSPSDEDDEWFGKGIYYWEHAYQQAWWWARRKHGEKAAVVGAVIRLGYCFDLLDSGNIAIFRELYGKMKVDFEVAGMKIPLNVRKRKKLDCAVFNYAYKAFEIAGCPLDTARAVYIPVSKSKRVYKGSWISEESHIQICVRNPKSIIAVWHVREDGRYGTRIRDKDQ